MRSVAVAVRLGVRSRRPAGQARVSILDGCPAVRSGASIRPPVRLEGAGEQDERALASGRRRLAPTTRPWPAIRGDLEVVLPGLKDAPPRVYRGPLGTFI
jgi:hypothetical protein